MPLAARTVGVWDWSLDPALLLVLATAALYATGNRLTVTPIRARREQRLRSACFYCALALLVIALNSPLDALSEKLFWVHMTQHVLLIAVVPPLLLLARPWSRLWRGFPLSWRRSLAGALVQGATAAPLRAAVRFLGRPAPSFVLFSVVLLGWHIPALFEATLRSTAAHALEHTLFLATSMLFWKHVIHSAPLRTPLPEVQRAAYVVGAMVVTWALAVVLALEPHALYSTYAHEASRPGGLSALADQQLAAGVMWVPGSVSFLIALFIQVNRWLSPAPPARRPRGLAGEH